MLSLILIWVFMSFGATSPESLLGEKLKQILQEEKLMGLQVSVNQDGHGVFRQAIGQKRLGEPIANTTLFRVASLSKSFSSVGLLQLRESGVLSLKDDISTHLGFTVRNPSFPSSPITVEMLLTHQSSLIECQPYYSNFLTASYSQDPSQIPSVSQILTEGGKFYNTCLFSAKHPPGTFFQYVNLNFGIAGTIIEAVSGLRFDAFMRDHILAPISKAEAENATFNAAEIRDPSELGTIYVGEHGEWTPSFDWYPDGKIPLRNLTGYKPGTNAVIFGPQGSLRASTSHLVAYMDMLRTQNTTILKPSSIKELTKPRYQYHGENGPLNDFHLYGLGLYTTTYRANDQVIGHQVVTGHLGSAYGLISGYHYWKEWSLAYMVNGALEGYKWGNGTIYEKVRLEIHEAIQQYTQSKQKQVAIQ